MAQNENFTDLTETFLRELVTEVRANTAIDIKCKIDVLKEMTNWVKVKNKVAPDGAEGSKIDEYRNALEAGKQPTKSGGIRGRDSRGSRDYGTPGERIAKLELHRVTTSLFKFEVGQRIVKVKGYSLSGEVKARWLTDNNEPRYVVDHKPLVPGMCHIYNEEQLREDKPT